MTEKATSRQVGVEVDYREGPDRIPCIDPHYLEMAWKYLCYRLERTSVTD